MATDTMDFAAPAQLIVASPQGRGRVVALVRATTRIGRDTGNDLVLESDLVSRRHAVLRIEGSVVVLEDLDSTNGTWVNGARVRRRVLANHDEVELGECVLRLVGWPAATAHNVDGQLRIAAL